MVLVAALTGCVTRAGTDASPQSVVLKTPAQLAAEAEAASEPATLPVGPMGTIAAAVGPSGRSRDRRGDTALAEAALTAARHRWSEIIDSLTSESERFRGWPADPREVVKNGHPFVIPVYTLDSKVTTSASLFEVTHQVPGSYVVGIEYKGKMIDALDWHTEDGAWFFSEAVMFGRQDLADGERELRAYFKSDHFRVRYVWVGPGMWVVGRHGSKEKAVWIHPGMGERANEPRSGIHNPADVIRDSTLPHPEI
jgi:hypothetical protein